MPLRDTLKALLAMFIFGTSFIAMREGMREIPPLMLNAARFFFSFFPAIFFLRRPAVPWPAMAAYGLALSVGLFGSVFAAIHLGIPIGLTSVVVQMQVFFTILIAALLFRERPTRLQTLGALLAGGGIVIFAVDRLASAPLVPFLLVLQGAFFWGVSNIIAKRTRPPDMVSFIVWASLFAPLPLVALSLVLDGPAAVLASFHWPSLPLALSIGYMAFGANILAFALWGGLLQRYPVGAVAPFGLLVPVFGMASGMLVYGEAMTLPVAIGSGVVVAGLALNVFGDRIAQALRPSG